MLYTTQADLTPPSELVLPTLLSNLPGLAYRCLLDEQFTMLFASEGCFELTGYRPEELMHNSVRSFGSLIHPADSAAVYDEVRQAVEAGTSYRLVYRLVTAEGDTKWVSEQGRAVGDPAHQPPVLEGFISDITAQKNAEDALVQRNNYLQIQQVAAASAHEATTVDAAIQSALDLVGAYTGWPVGHAWFVGSVPSLSSGLWRIVGNFRPLQEVSRSGADLTATDLVMRVCAEGRPIVIPLLTAVPDAPRLVAAAELGLRGSIGVPVTVDGKVRAVLEFFHADEAVPPARLLQVLQFVASQVGRVMERTLAQETLLQRERVFRALIENANDVITILDREGVIRYQSPAAERILGYRAEEMIGQSAFAYVHPDDFTRVTSVFANKISELGSQAALEFRLRHANGSWLTFEGQGKNLLADPSIAGMIVNSRDITERKCADVLMQQTNQMLEAMIQCSPAAIAVLDPAGLVKLWNPAAERIFGWKSDEVRGRPLPTVPVNRRAEHTGLRERVLAGEAVTDLELHRQRKDGTPIDISLSTSLLKDSSGQVYGIMSMMADITSRKRIERRLHLQGTALAAAVNAIVITDRYGTIIWVNPAFTQLTGYTAEETIGKNPRFLKSGIHPNGYYRKLWETVNAGKPWRGEVVNKRKDGTLYSEEMTVTPVRDAQGTVTHFIAIKQDITARKESEESLRDTNARLEQALADLKSAQQQVVQQERLRALGTMASGVAHDFNNALAAILGFSELLLSRPNALDDREKTLRYLQLMNIAAKDAGAVVNRLREFYRHRDESEVFTAVNLNAVVKEAVSLTQPRWQSEALGRGISYQVTTELGELPPLTGNPAEIREVLTNLIFNALDAMPHGGTLTIRTRIADGRAVLEVADTGHGMTEEVRRRCFEPFYSTKGEHGTGLGLSMVYGIINRHEGSIELASTPGQGTTFTIRFPLANGNQAEVLTADPAAFGRSQRVLLIEDEELVRNVLSELLSSEGHRVTAAADGRAGLEEFQRQPFDVILVDRAMPGLNGDQVAATIKSIAPQTPVILTTGFGSMMQAAGEKPAGVDFILNKPVTLDALRAAIARVTRSGGN